MRHHLFQPDIDRGPDTIEENNNNNLDVSGLVCIGCKKEFAAVGACTTHMKTCSEIVHTCTKCMALFNSLAALHGHQSNGACYTAASNSKHSRPVSSREVSQLTDALSPQPASSGNVHVHALKLIRDVDGEPMATVKTKCTAAQTALIDDECAAFERYLMATIKGRGDDPQAKHNTTKKYKAFLARVLRFLIPAHATSTYTALLSLDHAPTLMELVDHLFAAAPNHEKPKPPQRSTSLAHLQIVLNYASSSDEHDITFQSAHGYVTEKLAELRPLVLAHEKSQTVQQQLGGSVCKIFENGERSEETFRHLEERIKYRFEAQFTVNNFLKESTADQLPKVFRWLSLQCLSEGHMSQRKETFQWLHHGRPPWPLDESGKQKPVDEKKKFFLSFWEERGTFTITQMRNKIGSDFGSEVAPELTYMLLELEKQAEVGDIVFGDELGNVLSDGAFRRFEQGGFARAGLVGASIQNHRHSLATFLVREGVTAPINAPLASSYAKAFNSSTRSMFGYVDPHKTKSGKGSRAYTKEIAGAEQRALAYMHHRNLVFLRPISGIYVVPTLANANGTADSHGVGSILSVDPFGKARVALLEFNDASGVFQLNHLSPNIITLPIDIACAFKLEGVNDVEWKSTHISSSSGWLTNWEGPIVPKELLATLCWEYTPEIIVESDAPTNFHSGQLVIHGNKLAEIRHLVSSDSLSKNMVAILYYTQVGTMQNGITKWILKLTKASTVCVVRKSTLTTLLDWHVGDDGVCIDLHHHRK